MPPQEKADSMPHPGGGGAAAAAQLPAQPDQPHPAPLLPQGTAFIKKPVVFFCCPSLFVSFLIQMYNFKVC